MREFLSGAQVIILIVINWKRIGCMRPQSKGNYKNKKDEPEM